MPRLPRKSRLQSPQCLAHTSGEHGKHRVTRQAGPVQYNSYTILHNIMSQQQKNEFSEKLMISADGQKTASEKIPQIARPFVSEKALKYLDIVSLQSLCTASGY